MAPATRGLRSVAGGKGDRGQLLLDLSSGSCSSMSGTHWCRTLMPSAGQPLRSPASLAQKSHAPVFPWALCSAWSCHGMLWSWGAAKGLRHSSKRQRGRSGGRIEG